jgi:hypothetical protein
MMASSVSSVSSLNYSPRHVSSMSAWARRVSLQLVNRLHDRVWGRAGKTQKIEDEGFRHSRLTNFDLPGLLL